MMHLNDQTQRNMAFAGLPVAVSEGRYTGTLALLSDGTHGFDFFGGDGKVRRLVAIPHAPRARRKYERKNGRCTTIRPIAS